MRHRDIHILTAGAYTYTSDQRFQALHRQNTGQSSEWSEWTLCIKWAQERDQGLYECQISTIPVKSHQFRLNVVGKSASSITVCRRFDIATRRVESNGIRANRKKKRERKNLSVFVAFHFVLHSNESIENHLEIAFFSRK